MSNSKTIFKIKLTTLFDDLIDEMPPAKMMKISEEQELHKDPNKVCLMLQHTTAKMVPKHVKLIFDHYDMTSIEPMEILFLLVYILALESGFVTEEEYKKCQEKLVKVSPVGHFHARNITEISRFMPTYSKATDSFSTNLRSLLSMREEMTEHLASILTAVSVGDSLVVTISPKNENNLPGFSICLSVANYIKPQQKNPSVYRRLYDLADLTKVVRNEIFVPRLNQLYDVLETNISPSLEGLPYYLYDEIFQYLAPNDIRKCAHVSKTLYNSCKASRHINGSPEYDYDDYDHDYMFEY